jgi:hypothetical protein
MLVSPHPAATKLPADLLRDIDRPSAWCKYRKGLDELYKAGKGTSGSAQQEFDDYLISKYVELTDANIDVNTRRGFRIQYASYALLAAFAFQVATFSSYYSSTTMLATDPASEVTKMLSTKNAMVCVPRLIRGGSAFSDAFERWALTLRSARSPPSKAIVVFYSA